MRNLIIAVIFFIFSNCFSQDKKEENSDWNISVNGGSVYFLQKDVYWFLDGFNYISEHQLPIYGKGNWSMNHFEVTASYFFNKNHELGLTLGRSVFTSPYYKFLRNYYISNFDTTITISDGYRAYTDDWWGFFYNFHYKDYLYAGIKLAVADDIYECFLIGKKFNLKNSFFIKTELSYSFLNSDYLWNFSSAKSEKITFSFGLGLNL
jgi:hypothetical protein